MNKVLFLDRDGVINHDPGDYTMSLEEFVILPDVPKAIKLASDKGYKIVIITNQGGIAKGFYTHDEVHRIHSYLRDEVPEIDGIFYSPHHPDYSNSLTRKPESLLMERAIHRFKADVSRSVMIGDRDRDIQCASKVGVKGIQIPTNDSLLKYIESLD
jgi:D-glycero-D-manno-heptose 1,7-bisphosphate phosphatase